MERATERGFRCGIFSRLRPGRKDRGRGSSCSFSCSFQAAAATTTTTTTTAAAAAATTTTTAATTTTTTTTTTSTTQAK